MHVCNGRLCDVCRACVLEFVVQDGKRDVEPRQALNAKEVRKLLKLLANDKISREMKEHLYSRLLCSSGDKAKPAEESTELIKRSSSAKVTPAERQSHFSDSSGDETTECSEGLVRSCVKATSHLHGQAHRTSKMTKNDEVPLSLRRDKDDHEVFDLEL